VTFLNKRAKFAGLAGIALAATSAAVLFASQAAFATTAPGDNGTVKVHDSTTPVTDHQNDPQDVCQFYLDGFNFDGAQSVTWYIDSWPPTGNKTEVLNGTLTMGANGDGNTTDYSLPNGHYKLYWNFVPENGAAKQKVFWVNCPAPTPSQTTTTPGTPTSPAPTCTCESTPPTTPPAPQTSSSQTSSSHVQAAPPPVAVTGSLPVTG